MKFSIIAMVSVGMAAPSAKAEMTLEKKGSCPAAGSGNINLCCDNDGPDEGCRSRANCYTRCNHNGAIGCVAGCASVCPSKPEC